MSLSKNIKHYRRCAALPIRHFSGSSGAVEPPQKMSSKSMALTQWKLLSQLKEYVGRISNDTSLQARINSEFAQLLQKIQPSIYGSGIVRYFESTAMEQPQVQKKEPQQPSSLTNVINGLKLKIGSKEEAQVEQVPKWKTDVPLVSKSSIMSRTSHIINSVITAESDESRLKHIEDLSLHMQKFPETKNSAVKEGLVRILLRIRSQSKDPSLTGAIQEVFALVGFVDPLPGRGIRILSIDGGGIRGILVLMMLKKLEELTGKRVYEMFDYICGVSTGAILACTLGVLQESCDKVHKNYIDISTRVFTQSTIKGTSSLVWSHSYYDTNLWETLMKKQMGTGTLLSSSRMPKGPKVATVSAVVNQERLSAFVFRNYALPYRVQSTYNGSTEHKVWEAARASAAAPTYFEECRLGNLLHQDGGILVNNPTAVAIHEAKLLWPDSAIQCVVSFGTGRTVPNPIEACTDQEIPSVSSWKNKFFKILDSATDTEGVHTMLSDLLPENVYFRFNPYLTEMLSMVEIEPKKLEQLERDAVMYLRRNEDKFQQAAKALMEPRTCTQKAIDYLNYHRELLGLSSKL